MFSLVALSNVTKHLFRNLAFFFLPVIEFSFSSIRDWGLYFLYLPSWLLSNIQALWPCFLRSRLLHVSLKAFCLPFFVRYLTLAVSMLQFVLLVGFGELILEPSSTSFYFSCQSGRPLSFIFLPFPSWDTGFRGNEECFFSITWQRALYFHQFLLVLYHQFLHSFAIGPLCSSRGCVLGHKIFRGSRWALPTSSKT